MRSFVKIFVFAVLAAFVGCATVSPDKNHATIQDSVATVKADLAAALRSIADAMVGANPESKAILNQASLLIDHANASVDLIPTANDKWKKDYDLKAADDDKVRASWGWKIEQLVKAFFWTSIIVGVVVVIVLPLLYSFFGSSLTVFGSILRQLHAALPVQNLGNWVNRLILKKTVVAVPTSMTITNPTAQVQIATDGTKTASAVPYQSPLPYQTQHLATAADASTLATGEIATIGPKTAD